MTHFSQDKVSLRAGSLIALFMMSVLLCTRLAFADDIVPGHVLIGVTTGTDINAVAAAHGTTVQDHVPNVQTSLGVREIYSLALPNGRTEIDFAAELAADTRLVYAEPDRFLVSPEVEGNPFHLPFDRSSQPKTYAMSVGYAQINLGKSSNPLRGGGGRLSATGHGTVVAVLDTGVDFTHPDLRHNLLLGYNVLAPGMPPLDAADGIANAEFGHGTMIAGIIVRLAPLTRILPVRVINGDGSGTILGLAKGVHFANTQGVDVINLSLSCSVTCGTLNDALDESETAGIILVAAAGNLNTDRVNPPAKNHGTISVASVEADNRKSPYSNYGSFVKVVAPGSDVRSTYPGGQYATWSGTSFAAPFVAAQAALILSVRPSLTADGVKDIIRHTTHSVENVNPNYRRDLGDGIIDIEASIRAARR